MKTLRDEVENEVIETFEHWHTELEENGEVFEHATAMVNNYRNIIDIAGKDRLGLDASILKDMNDVADEAAMGNFKNKTATMNYTKSALEDAKNALAKANTEHDKEYWQDQVDNLEK